MALPTTTLSLPQLGLIAGTRGLLGAGIALLTSERLSKEQRQAVGWTLFWVGAISTLPLVLEVFGQALARQAERVPTPRWSPIRDASAIELA